MRLRVAASVARHAIRKNRNRRTVLLAWITAFYHPRLSSPTISIEALSDRQRLSMQAEGKMSVIGGTGGPANATFEPLHKGEGIILNFDVLNTSMFLERNLTRCDPLSSFS